MDTIKKFNWEEELFNHANKHITDALDNKKVNTLTIDNIDKLLIEVENRKKEMTDNFETKIRNGFALGFANVFDGIVSIEAVSNYANTATLTDNQLKALDFVKTILVRAKKLALDKIANKSTATDKLADAIKELVNQ